MSLGGIWNPLSGVITAPVLLGNPPEGLVARSICIFLSTIYKLIFLISVLWLLLFLSLFFFLLFCYCLCCWGCSGVRFQPSTACLCFDTWFIWPCTCTYCTKSIFPPLEWQSVAHFALLAIVRLPVFFHPLRFSPN